MVQICAAVGCNNTTVNNPNVTFHRIPANNDKNKQLRKQWLHNIKRKDPPKDSCFFVCSEHFESDCFERDLRVCLFIFFIDIKPSKLQFFLFFHNSKISVLPHR